MYGFQLRSPKPPLEEKLARLTCRATLGTSRQSGVAALAALDPQFLLIPSRLTAQASEGEGEPGVGAGEKREVVLSSGNGRYSA